VSSNVSWAGSSSVAYISPAGTAFCNTPGDVTISAQLDSQVASASFNCVLKRVTPPAGFAEHAQQFDGPFASWINVKVAFGAKGDGLTDDTKALQSALDFIAVNPSVLWIPKGTYSITGPLHIQSTQQFSIIGEDPSNTSIEWNGSVGGTMLTLEGCTWFRLARLSWDGTNTAAVALHVASTLQNGENYPTFDDIEDQKISRVDIGLQVGFAGETSVQRVHFDHNTKAGISLENWDALNFNVVDSLFTDCNIGVTNIYGAGAFNVSNSVFVRSQTADMMMGNTGPFSERQNISFNSHAFFLSLGNGAGANIVFQGNTISNPGVDPIQIANPGPVMLIDNQFLGLDSSLHVLSGIGANPLGVFSLGNEFAVTAPFGGNLGKTNSIDEATGPSNSALTMEIPSEVYIPAPSLRTTFEIPKDSPSSTIQQIIDEAATVQGGAVVHFPSGTFAITQTINIPDSPNLSLAGDGPVSVLLGSPSLSGPVVHITGTRVRLENMQITAAQGAIVAAGLEIDVDDQPSTAVHCDQCKTLHTGTAIQANGLDNALVDFRIGALNAVDLGASISGGKARVDGNQTLGRVDAFMTSVDAYNVNNSGHFLVEDGWHDVGQGSSQFTVTESGVVTHQGGTIYTNAPSSMNAEQFSGEVSLLGVSTDSTFVIDSTSNAEVMIAGTLQETGLQLVNLQGQKTEIAQLSNFGVVNNRTPTPFADDTASTAWIEHMFAQSRTEYVVPRIPLLTPATDITLHRIVVGAGKVGILLLPRQLAGTSATYSISSPTTSNENGMLSSSGCSNGSISMAGEWSLQEGQDGFYGLKIQDSFLSNRASALDLVDGIGLSPAMSDAGERWIIRPAGDGLFKIINRANGEVLTRRLDGCATLSPEQGTISQEWAVSLWEQ